MNPRSKDCKQARLCESTSWNAHPNKVAKICQLINIFPVQTRQLYKKYFSCAFIPNLFNGQQLQQVWYTAHVHVQMWGYHYIIYMATLWYLSGRRWLNSIPKRTKNIICPTNVPPPSGQRYRWFPLLNCFSFVLPCRNRRETNYLNFNPNEKISWSAEACSTKSNLSMTQFNQDEGCMVLWLGKMFPMTNWLVHNSAKSVSFLWGPLVVELIK